MHKTHLSAKNAPDAMGAPGDPPLALRKAIAKGRRPNNAGHPVSYLEIYESDVVADEMQPLLRYGVIVREVAPRANENLLSA
jgi:hypothetical protein